MIDRRAFLSAVFLVPVAAAIGVKPQPCMGVTVAFVRDFTAFNAAVEKAVIALTQLLHESDRVLAGL